MTRLIGLFTLAFAAACGPRPEARSTLPTPATRIEVQGHRGARAVLPEESIAAYTRALEVGADTLETDVAVTKDDHLVLLHDLRINPARCLGPDGQRLSRPPPPVRSLTLAEMKQLDCGALPHDEFPKQVAVPGSRVATLDELFELVRSSPLPAAKTVQFNIEMKAIPSHPELTLRPGDLARRILDAARAHGMSARIMIQSFDHAMLAAVKAIAPTVPISLLVEGTRPDLTALAANAHAEIVSPELDWVTREDVVALHAHGVKVIPWTANTPEAWSYLVSAGVDGIITDDPGALVGWLRGQGLR